MVVLVVVGMVVVVLVVLILISFFALCNQAYFISPFGVGYCVREKN